MASNNLQIISVKLKQFHHSCCRIDLSNIQAWRRAIAASLRMICVGELVAQVRAIRDPVERLTALLFWGILQRLRSSLILHQAIDRIPHIHNLCDELSIELLILGSNWSSLILH